LPLLNIDFPQDPRTGTKSASFGSEQIGPGSKPGARHTQNFLNDGDDGAMLILLAVLIALLLVAAPAWPYSRGWGYYPSGTVGTILLILILLMLLGYVHV
jgi:hypothetical protein